MLIKWHGSENPPYVSLVDTGNFTDGSLGDTSTYETGEEEQGGSPCQVRNGDAWITGVYDFLSPTDLTAYRFTYQLTESASPVDCGNEPPVLAAPVKTYSLEVGDSYTTDPGDRTVIASGTLTDLAGTLSGSFPALTSARYVWLRINYEIETYDGNGGALPEPTPNKYTYARISDFRITSAGDCGLPDATKDLTRGTTGSFNTDGTTAPTIDEWEIYRCISDSLTLIDSGDLGFSGLAGFRVAESAALGKDFDIYAPPGATIATDYEARMDSAGGLSINFNIIAPAGAGANTMPERPSVFEEFRHGFQPSGDQGVQANRKLKTARMGIPDPQQNSSQAMEQGGDGVVDLVPYKEWTDIVVSLAELSYLEKIEMLYTLFGEPYIKTIPGAVNARDVIWYVTTDKLESAARITVEQGQEDYPSRIRSVEMMSATITLGKQTNSAEFNGIGRKLDEELAAFTTATPTEPAFVPINAARNNHYLGTAYSTAGTAVVGCDVHQATFTFPQRRQALFTQCPGEGDAENTWKDTVRVAAPIAMTLEMSHTQRSRQLGRDIRNKTKYFYKWLNRSDVNIDAGIPYEAEIAAPVKFDDRGGGDTDAVTTGVHNMVPVKDSTFDPWGIGTPTHFAIRVRAPWTAKPTSTNL
jgi:hypothetical protein